MLAFDKSSILAIAYQLVHMYLTKSNWLNDIVP